MPAAVSSPDFFPAEADRPPPAPAQENKFENFSPYEKYPLDWEVNDTDPSPSRAIALPHHCLHQCRTALLSSSLYGDMPEVSETDPSPAAVATYAQIATRPRRRVSSSSSSSSLLLPPTDSVASCTRSRSHTPEHPKIYMPQISLNPLPVLKEREGLEENENVAINIVDRHTSRTVVQRKKKKKKKKDTLSEKWTKQQKENFERFGDICYQEPYDNYHVSAHSTPIALAPQPQAEVQ